MKNLVGKNRMKQHNVAFRVIRKKRPILLYTGLSICDYCDFENIGSLAFYVRNYRKDGITKGAFLFCKDCTNSRNWDKEDIFNEPQILPVFVIDEKSIPLDAESMSINHKNIDTKIYRGDVGGISVYDAYNTLIDSVVTVDRTKYAGRPEGTWKGVQISSPEIVAKIVAEYDSPLSLEGANERISMIQKSVIITKTPEYIEAKKKNEDDFVISKKNFGEFQKEISSKLNFDDELKALSYYYENNLYIPDKYSLFIGDGGLTKKW